MQRAFVILWTSAAIVAAGLMVLLYVSLIPHFADIGDWAVWVVRLGMVCSGFLMVAFTWFKIKSMHTYSKFTRHGEVVSYVGEKQPYVISAIHEQAKIPQYVMAAKEEKLEPREEDIIQVYNDGVSTLQQIADSFEMKYNKVQSIVASAKKRGLINRK